MATYLEAADFAAFPFREVTNSSSVLLAQSFGLPVLIRTYRPCATCHKRPFSATTQLSEVS